MKFRADSNSVKLRHVDSGVLPCVLITSLKKVVHGDKCHFRHFEAKGKPNKKSKKGGAKDRVVYLKILIRECPFYVNKGDRDRSTPSNSSRAPGTKSKFGKERVHREVLSKSVRLMSVVLARRNSRTDHMRRPCTKSTKKGCARRVAWDLAKTIYKLKNSDKATLGNVNIYQNS